MRLILAIITTAVISHPGPCRSLHADEGGWKAGVARAVITPRESMWMAGYGARDRPSEGVQHDLWAKAIAIEDPTGHRALLMTLDLCGIDRSISNSIRDELRAKHGLDRADVVLAVSHTHSGPVVGTNLISMYPLDQVQRDKIDRYTETLRGDVARIAGEALSNLKPAELSWGLGRCGFAVNRRDNDQGRVPELRESVALKGPDDHDVPVLTVAELGGDVRAIVFGYACHCTTLDFYKFSGDYAGFAQLALERAYPQAQAMFWAGCGADQNPLPRRTEELAEDYGLRLASSVERVLESRLRPITGELRTAYREIELPFAEVPPKSHWESLAKSDNRYEAGRARLLLERIRAEGELLDEYPYPVQLWRLGDGPRWYFLGGEVVVDYALRIKRNLGSESTWVSAYCNDVMAYIPSLRILKEGGYEGGGAMVYYGQPSPWSESVEDRIIDAVAELARAFDNR